jgi:hypothetical protein
VAGLSACLPKHRTGPLCPCLVVWRVSCRHDVAHSARVWLAVITVRFVAVKVRKWRRAGVVRPRMDAEAGPNVLRGPLI